MDPWNHIRRAVTDHRSGSVEVTLRAAQGLAHLSSRKDVMRAARALLRAHPSMAALWRILAEMLRARDAGAAAGAFAERLAIETDAAADNLRWVIGRRAVVVTHSSSSSVALALERVRARIVRVVCTASMPGGEGRVFARRLERAGFETDLVPDAAVARAAAGADVAIVGADAVTERAVVNKVGTHPLALAAQDAGLGCYAIAGTAKLLPDRVRVDTDAFEATPLALFDAVLTERGPRRPGAVRKAVGRIRVPRALEAILR